MRRAIVALLAAVSGALVMVGVQALTAPQCPQEDSCSIDYRDGAWHVTEVTP